MGREVLVNGHLVDENISNMQTAINNLGDLKVGSIKVDGNENLNSLIKLRQIITDFEDVLTSYVTLAENDGVQVDLVKEKLIEEDNRIVDLRIFK